jgi:glycosyltransferase involved in cell wall biosynthesis
MRIHHQMQPLVSILIPAYNAERWLADTIESAIAQTWPQKEIIVVDDGSTDQTLTIAREFERNAVRVVTQPNQGAAAARNQAFSLSRGDYIQWLDADDLLSRDKIAKQMEAAEKCRSKRTLLSSGWGYFMYRPSKARLVPTCLWSDLSPVEWLVRKMSHNLHMMNATWLVSRELTEAAGPWDTRLSLDDDGEYFCRVLLASNGTQFLFDAKSYYRISGSNSLSKVDCSNKKLESLWLSMQLHIGYLRALEDSERARATCVTFLQNWLQCFYPDRSDLVREAQQLAASLGGRLSIPKASWKYAWIEKLFGFAAAKHTQSYYNRAKSSALTAWDRIMQSFERDRALPG